MSNLWLESQTYLMTPLIGRHKCLSNNYTFDARQRWGLKAWQKWPLSPVDPPEAVVKDQYLSRVKGVQRCAKVVFVASLKFGKSMISSRDRVPTARCSGFTFPVIYMYTEYRYTHTRNLLPIASFLSSAWSIHSGAPWVRKWNNLPFRENLVITWTYTYHPPERPSVRTTVISMWNNSINRYGNPNATRGYFGGKSHSHRRLVKQRQKKLFLYPCCLINIKLR